VLAKRVGQLRGQAQQALSGRIEAHKAKVDYFTLRVLDRGIECRPGGREVKENLQEIINRRHEQPGK